MIQAFRRKLRSQRGASMLLALLFLALCTMVAASILMASAANAGKHRSNLTEHQQYLALSSAVSLLCDELSAAEYRAQYTCWTTTEDGGKDEDGNPITYTSYHFNQESGYYSGTLSSILQKNFDAIFAATIDTAPALSGYATKGKLPTDVPATHTLTLKPSTDIPELDSQEVTVKLEVKDNYAMYLTATLEGYENYTMEAELTPISSNVHTLPPTLENNGADVVQQTNAMEWKIGWITTGQEEEETP